MADNVYLLETRLSPSQQNALETIRSVARDRGLTVFLVGGAVRDLISGSPVRDLDVVVQGNALELREQLEAAGAVYSGEAAAQQSLYVRFPSGVRVEVGSTLSATYPKPGKAVYQPTTILEDLRRRDFTANAMALSLNEGSYGLLMDPLNGVADIENRELRLVSNYGFIEDPVRLIRAARFMARLGWQMDERTRTRYETAKEENYIAALQSFERSYELEELFHEEEPVRVMRRLEDEGWLKVLSPQLSASKVNAPELARLKEAQMSLETRGIRADAAAANFPLLVGKMPANDLEAIKKSFPRRAFVEEIETLDGAAKDLSALLLSKAMNAPSESYKLILRSNPVAVLWSLHTTKSNALQTKFKNFATEWPQAQTKIPFVLMAEMRITPDLPEFGTLQESLFYALMDGRLSTPEEMKAFLEPYSPPAPPPVVPLRRPRAPKKEAKAKKKAAVDLSPENQATPVEASSETAAPEPVAAVNPQPVKAKKADAPVTAAGTQAKSSESVSKAVASPKKAATGKAAASTARPAPAKKTASKTASARKPAKAAKPSSSKPAKSLPKKAPAAAQKKTKGGLAARSNSAKAAKSKAPAPRKTPVAPKKQQAKNLAKRKVAPAKKAALPKRAVAKKAPKRR